MMTLAARIERERHTRGWSHGALSDATAQAATRVNRSYLWSLESGRGNPSLEVLVRIAAGFGLTLQQLLAGVDLSEYRGSK